MSKSKHTPGPWTVGYHCYQVEAPKGMSICDIRGWGYLTGKGHGALGLPHDEAKEIQDANARLIAAAPEMLEAFNKIKNESTAMCESIGDELLEYFIDRIIEKAEGRGP
jgi:hypothetical protein